MKIDNTLERIAKETVEECATKNIKVSNQDVYRCLNFVINCIGLAISKGVPVEIPYLGKIIPKVRVKNDLGKSLEHATTEEERAIIKAAILEKGHTKRQRVSEYKNQRAYTEKEIDDLLEGHIDRRYTMLRFAFNDETKKAFLERLNVANNKERFQV